MATMGLLRTNGARSTRVLDQFFVMCQNVLAFLAKQPGTQLKAYLCPDGAGSISLFVMSDSEAYDFELSGRLSEFAAPYVERGLLTSVTLLPASSTEELAAFFNVDLALRVEMAHA